jgi:AcrR family transcriptional regulator
MLSNDPHQGDGQGPGLRSTFRKRQILDGARQVFFMNGHAGASMDEIAVQAGVSKGTLYHHFDSKDALFRSIISAEAERIARVLPSPDHNNPNPACALRQVGIVVLEALDNPGTISTLRLVIGALGRFPHLGEEFLLSSLGRTVEGIAEYLKASMAAGYVRVREPRAVAEQFARRCLSHVMERVLVPDRPRQTEAERAVQVEEVLSDLGLATHSSKGV